MKSFANPEQWQEPIVRCQKVATEIDQTVSSWSNLLLKLFRRQASKQFLCSFQVGLPRAESGIDERLLRSHSFTCLPFGRIASPQSSLFLPRVSASSLKGVATWLGPHDPAE